MNMHNVGTSENSIGGKSTDEGSNIKKFLHKEINFNYWKEDVEGFLTYFLFVVIVGFPLVELIGVLTGHTHVWMEPLLRTIAIVGGIFLIAIFFVKRQHILVLSDVFIITSIIFSIISIAFSNSIYISLTGVAENWAEDPVQVLGYFVVFLMATHIVSFDNRKKIIVAFLIATVFQTFVANLQHFGFWPYEAFKPDENPVAFGLTQQQNFYGALAVMFSLMTTVIFLAKKTNKLGMWYVVALICFTSSFYAWCRLVWVGLASGILFLIFVELYCKIKQRDSVICLKRFYLLMASYVVVIVLLVLFDDVIISQVDKIVNEVTSDNVKNLGTGRMNTWMAGLESVKDNLLTGVGFDYYPYVYKLHPEYMLDWYAFKGHNEFLHILVTQGLPSLINYLAFCIYVVIFAIKNYMNENTSNRQRAIIYMLLIMVIGYYCQSFFNNSITNIAPYKWIVMGLLLPRVKQKKILCKEA